MTWVGAHAREAIEAVRERLDGRRLVWFGIRGEDAESLLRFQEFVSSFAITAPLQMPMLDADANVTLEALRGERPDLDRYDIDLDRSEAANEFRRRLLQDVSSRCVVMTYRPAAFVSALAFSMFETMTLAGLFKDRQAAFEHKPWVETSLSRRGVRTLDWRYIADAHRGRVRRSLADGPVVMRASRSSGGVGVTRAEVPEDVDLLWPDEPDEFVGVSRFVGDGIPLNFGGCVFPNGKVRLHPPSLQLIGLSVCTDRPFGYCGNDFGAASHLAPTHLAQLDELGRAVGKWLHEERYVGAFGVDAMLVNSSTVAFLEVNARFQGSSSLGAVIAQKLGVTDLFIDHLAASLGLGAKEDGPSLSDWATKQPAVSHLVLHNQADHSVSVPFRNRFRSAASARLALVPPADLPVAPGGVFARLVFARAITETGFAIDADSAGAVRSILEQASAAGRAVV